MQKLSKHISVLFAVYFLLINSGITITHVYCDLGEQWVFGSEVPPQKHCKKQKNNCHLADSNKKNNRNKNTFSFDFKFEGISNHDGNLIHNLELDCYLEKTPFFLVEIFPRLTTEMMYTHPSHDPPLDISPSIIALQVFRI